MRSKTRKHSSNKTRKIPLAGQAIAAGGFGCVFRPPIKCNTQSDRVKQTKKEYISKIMESRYAIDEMEEVNKFLPVIKTIPSYKNYFLLDGIFQCDTDDFTASDKKNLDTKCRNLTKIGIRSSNINQKLSKIKALNIPDGGVSVRKTMESLANKLVKGDKEEKKRFGHLNNSMIRTLKNAIVPMNKKGIIHCDLKGDNMLVKAEKLASGEPYVKVIDWGLGGKFNPNNKGSIPEAVKNRPVQFNAPFGVILFDSSGINNAANSMSLVHAGESIYKILAYKIIEKSNYYGPGHTGYLTQILFPNLSNPFITINADDKPDGFSGSSASDIKKTLFANGIIVTHIQKVLEKYYDPSKGHHGTFDEQKYFHEVYRWNVDVWGFLMGYIELLTKAAQFSYSKYRTNKALQILANIVYKYCFSGNYAAEKIPVVQLERELQEVSNAISGFKSKGIVKDSVPAKIPVAKPKKIKKKIKLKAKTHSAPKATLLSIPAGKKRCPKGYTKENMANGIKCRKKGTKKVAKKAANKTRKSPNNNPAEFFEYKENGKTYIQLRKRGRTKCPKGYTKVRIENGYLTCIKKTDNVVNKPKRVAKKAKKTKKVPKNVGTDSLFDPRFRLYTSGGFRGLIARDKTRKRCPNGFKKRNEVGGYLVCAKK